VVLECRLLHTIEIGIHTQFIGEIVDVKGDPEVFGEDGQLDIMKIKPLVYDPSHKGYHGVGPCLGKAFSIGTVFMHNQEVALAPHTEENVGERLAIRVLNF
jgi:hypothetical protein